jgi:hypothetical protein
MSEQFHFLPVIKTSGFSGGMTTSAGRAAEKAARGQRAVGGRFTTERKPVRGVAPHTLLNRRTALENDPGAPPAVPGEQDLSKGILSCQERGLLPPTFDMTPVITGQLGNNPIQVGSVKLHRSIDQFKRQDILTQNYGFAPVMNIKFDIKSIEAMPAVPPPPKPPAPPSAAKIPTSLPVAQNATLPTTLVTDADKQREDARQYAELLDMYSLHEFIIRKGQTLRNTPEFVSYQRKYQTQWGAISRIIKLLEDLLSAYGVPIAYIDGKKVGVLANVDLGDPTKEELLNCIANRSEVEPLMVSLIQQFRQGDRGHNVAATKIQALFRMWRQRTAYAHMKAATAAARCIQRQWGVHKAHMKTRKTIGLLREGLIFRWRETMAQFIKEWPNIKQNRRIILHIPSLSYPAFQTQSMPFYKYFQAGQLPRLMDLADPNVEMIFICPYQLEPEALEYYYKVLRRIGVQDPETRVLFLVPELAKRLPTHLSLTRLVLMSSKLMKCLASVVKGKVAYIVPGVVSQEELTLAGKLNLPLLGPEPKVAQLLSTKSGLKSIFEAADVRPPIGAHNIKDERDLYMILARFIAEYPEYHRWVIKIDTEFHGRGTAFLDIRRLKCWDNLSTDAPATVVAEQVFSELRENAAKRVKILNTGVYPDWAAFMKVFGSVGGCVEACPKEVVASPVVNMFIEPNGEINILSIQEQILHANYNALGVLFPQTQTPHEALRDAARAIAAAAYRKKVMGYMTVDFILHRRDDGLRLWAVDLELRLTTNALIHQFALFMSEAYYDANSGQCLTLQTDREAGGRVVNISYGYTGLMYHPYIGGLKHSIFSSYVRSKGLTFDTEAKTGVLFHFVDIILCGCFGVLAVGKSKAHAMSLIIDVLDFVQSHLSKSNANLDDVGTNFNAVYRAIRDQSTASHDRTISGERRR